MNNGKDVKSFPGTAASGEGHMVLVKFFACCNHLFSLVNCWRQQWYFLRSIHVQPIFIRPTCIPLLWQSGNLHGHRFAFLTYFPKLKGRTLFFPFRCAASVTNRHCLLNYEDKIMNLHQEKRDQGVMPISISCHVLSTEYGHVGRDNQYISWISVLTARRWSKNSHCPHKCLNHIFTQPQFDSRKVPFMSQ